MVEPQGASLPPSAGGPALPSSPSSRQSASSEQSAPTPDGAPKYPKGGDSRTPLFAALAGAAIVVVIAAILFATGAAHFGSRSPANSAGSDPIAFPAKLAGFEDLKTATGRLAGNGRAKQDLAYLSKMESLTSAAYHRAYGGAAVGVRAYGNRDLSEQVTVIGVRASSPGLTYGPVIDAATLGENAPPNQVVDVGAVSCLVVDNIPAAAGTPVKPSSEATAHCQRSGPRLTVSVFGTLTGNSGRQTMVAATNEAWAAAANS